jgi:hypothetical protein
MSEENIKSFSEVAKLVGRNSKFDQYGEKTTMGELVGKVVVVREFVHVNDYEDKTGNTKQLYLVAVETLPDKKKMWFFSSSPWVTRYKDFVPFKAKIGMRKSKGGPNRAFVFEEP